MHFSSLGNMPTHLLIWSSCMAHVFMVPVDWTHEWLEIVRDDAINHQPWSTNDPRYLQFKVWFWFNLHQMNAVTHTHTHTHTHTPHTHTHTHTTGALALWVECLLMVWEMGFNPCWVIPKIQKMVLNATLPNTQHYKIRIKGKGKQSR